MTYTPGAIDSVQKFLEGINLEDGAVTPMYFVHALGASSFTTVEKIEAPVRFDKPIDTISLFFRSAQAEGSLADRGIIANTYNKHKCFFSKRDADAYLATCKRQNIDLPSRGFNWL